MSSEYDFIVTVRADMPLDEVQAALLGARVDNVIVESVQWIP